VAKDELEHVTLHIKKNPEAFRTKYVKKDLLSGVLKKESLTVDYPEDLALCNKILRSIGNDYSFKSEDIINAVKKGI
jgi:spore coat polysaccharide biosynthesis protein SpsF (cytidylyltransferase family)